MNKKNMLIVLLIFLIYSNVQPQFLKIGFRIEPAIMFAEVKNESNLSFIFSSFYLTSLVEPTELFGLEFRPGYIIGGEYTGLELGAFLHFKIKPTNFYIVAGLNNHSNDVSNAHNGGASYIKNMLYKGIGIGYQKDSKLGFDLMYYWTNNKSYGYNRITDDLGNATNIDKQMNGILKVGFNLAWDIF